MERSSIRILANERDTGYRCCAWRATLDHERRSSGLCSIQETACSTKGGRELSGALWRCPWRRSGPQGTKVIATYVVEKGKPLASPTPWLGLITTGK